jgi:hypothetical protein
VDQRCPWHHGLLGIEESRQGLVGDQDRGARPPGGLGAGRGYRGDRLPDEADAVAGEDGFIANGAAVVDLGNVGRGDDRPDAGQRRCGAGVDTSDAGVGNRAPHHRAVQHAGQCEVWSKDRGPRDLSVGVEPAQPAAEGAIVAHGATRSAVTRVAAITASMIFW